jgi:anion-transporting  ArsA/GET3 family ATPase
MTSAILTNPTRFLFFTGKGGVGKTSLSTAVVFNKSILASGTHDPLLTARMIGERKQIERISELSKLVGKRNDKS